MYYACGFRTASYRQQFRIFWVFREKSQLVTLQEVRRVLENESPTNSFSKIL